jgi:hypothetical protein
MKAHLAKQFDIHPCRAGPVRDLDRVRGLNAGHVRLTARGWLGFTVLLCFAVDRRG